MAGKALPSFADFVLATNERQLTPSSKLINDHVQQCYILRDVLKGRGIDEVVQSGTKITDRIQLRAGSGFGFYNPNETFSPAIEDTLTKMEVPWSFGKTHWSWVDHEIILNEGDPFVQYKKLRDAKKQAAMIGMFNGLEAALFASHSDSAMEAASPVGPRRPYSLRSFVTEDGMAPVGSTTIMGINPTNEPNWRNQVVNYQAADLDGTLLGAFDEMWIKTKFEAPETKDKYFTETRFGRQKILTSLDGWKTCVRILRNGNDRNYPVNDMGYASDDPVYGRIPVKWAPQLDLVGYANGQPRYMWINFEFLIPVFHSKRYFYNTDPIMGGHQQPFSWVVYTDIWYNWFCRSRKRQGIVVPI